jgi:hypothetical protein
MVTMSQLPDTTATHAKPESWEGDTLHGADE